MERVDTLWRSGLMTSIRGQDPHKEWRFHCLICDMLCQSDQCIDHYAAYWPLHHWCTTSWCLPVPHQHSLYSPCYLLLQHVDDEVRSASEWADLSHLYHVEICSVCGFAEPYCLLLHHTDTFSIWMRWSVSCASHRYIYSVHGLADPFHLLKGNWN